MAPRKSDPATELSRRLLEGLQRARADGTEPIPLEALIRASGTEPASDLAAAALGKPPFKTKAIVPVKSAAAVPVALNDPGGIQRLAADPRLLVAALESLYASGPPPWTLPKVAGAVATSIRRAFKDHVSRYTADHALPPEVAVVRKGKIVSYYLAARPLPVVALARRLIEALLKLKEERGLDYPLPLAALAACVEPAGDPALLAEAGTHAPFAERVVCLDPKNAAAPLMLKEDLAHAASSPAVLQFLVGSLRSSENSAFAAKDLVKKVAMPLRNTIVAALDAVSRDQLAGGCGYVLIKGNRHFFALSDVETRSLAPRPAPTAANAAAFAAAFDEAFTRLDRQHGSLNFVSLLDLRRVLSQFTPEQFNANLLELRRQRRYSLKAAEGLDGIAPDERAAGIAEEGDLLLHVSRIRS